MERLINVEDVKKLLVARYEGTEYIEKDIDRLPTVNIDLHELNSYKDTGLTPGEIDDFKAWLNEDREELNDITIFNDLSELIKYRKTGITPEEIIKLKQELENWKRESISDKAKLGEIRIWL